MLTTAVIGSGNLAHHLVQAIQKAGIGLNGIWARDTQKAQKLANRFELHVFTALNQIPAETDVVFLTISDSAVAEIAAQVDTKGIIVHCSGVLPVAELGERAHRGVFWPVQTFTQQVAIDFKKVHIVVQAEDEEDKRILEVMADAIGAKAMICDERQRQILHVAAVMVNNFSNHLATLAQQLLDKNGLSLEVLKPLILETALKLQHADPELAQTGPAKRGDTSSLNLHRHLLENEPGLLKIYNLLTESIGNKL